MLDYRNSLGPIGYSPLRQDSPIKLYCDQRIPWARRANSNIPPFEQSHVLYQTTSIAQSFRQPKSIGRTISQSININQSIHRYPSIIHSVDINRLVNHSTLQSKCIKIAHSINQSPNQYVDPLNGLHQSESIKINPPIHHSTRIYQNQSIHPWIEIGQSTQSAIASEQHNLVVPPFHPNASKSRTQSVNRPINMSIR